MAARPLPEGLSAEQFEQRLRLAALRVASRDCARVLKSSAMSPVVLRQRGVRNVVEDPEGDPQRRLVLLAPPADPEKLEETLPAAAWAFVSDLLTNGQATVTSYEVVLGYENLSADEALERLLPKGVEIPSSFETIGHIAHFNLRSVHEPYKALIGRIVLDKNRGLRTVVNKVGDLFGDFRTFPMEVLAGEPSLHTTVREQGLTFELDYGEVYWNSRLSAERQRVVKLLSGGDTVVDMFAGIGAMSCFAATAGCRVFSNDLNPRGAHWMRVNAKRNLLEQQVEVHNRDARDFFRHLAAEDGLFSASRHATVHVIMNLPELALGFLDVFRGICSDEDTPGPCHIHCYCFARGNPPDAEILPVVEAALGRPVQDVRIVCVRDVAPNKIMYCVEFQVPEAVLRDTPAKRRRLEEDEGRS